MGGGIPPVRIAVIDYESGNLRSVARALETSGASACITGDPDEIGCADALVLPGVGSGPAAMEALGLRGLAEPLRRYVASGKPFLGVCLGLQLLLDHTEEGDAPCLGIIPGTVKRLPPGLKVPHMGWNSVDFKKGHPVLAGIPQGSYFYFVHSYYLLQCLRSGKPGGYPVPPGKERERRPSNLSQLCRPGGRISGESCGPGPSIGPGDPGGQERLTKCILEK
jgi:glutamine amidotransferase